MDFQVPAPGLSNLKPNKPKPSPYGGARPGAGRKKSETHQFQHGMRARFEACINQDDADEVIGVILAMAKAGDINAFHALEPWIFGAIPKQIAIDVEQRVSVATIYLPERGPILVAPVIEGGTKALLEPDKSRNGKA